jgi:hypothetical protein
MNFPRNAKCLFDVIDHVLPIARLRGTAPMLFFGLASSAQHFGLTATAIRCGLETSPSAVKYWGETDLALQLAIQCSRLRPNVT